MNELLWAFPNVIPPKNHTVPQQRGQGVVVQTSWTVSAPLFAWKPTIVALKFSAAFKKELHRFHGSITSMKVDYERRLQSVYGPTTTILDLVDRCVIAITQVAAPREVIEDHTRILMGKAGPAHGLPQFEAIAFVDWPATQHQLTISPDGMEWCKPKQLQERLLLREKERGSQRGDQSRKEDEDGQGQISSSQPQVLSAAQPDQLPVAQQRRTDRIVMPWKVKPTVFLPWS